MHQARVLVRQEALVDPPRLPLGQVQPCRRPNQRDLPSLHLPEHLQESLPVDAQGVTRAIDYLANAAGLVWRDKRRLLFSEIKGKGLHMAIVEAEESRAGARDVYVPASERGMAHRSYPSPDGRWVLVVEMDGPWLPCRLVPMDGSSAGQRVGPPGAACTSAAWSPDGKWMYFSSSSGGAFHV